MPPPPLLGVTAEADNQGVVGLCSNLRLPAQLPKELVSKVRYDKANGVGAVGA